MSEHLKSQTEFYALAQIKIPVKVGQRTTSVIRKFYQNYRAGQTFAFEGRNYEWLSFNAGLPPRRLELDSSQGQVIIPNSPQIRDLYNQHNGFSETIVIVRFLFPKEPDAAPLFRKAQVINSDISGAEVRLELGTPIGLQDGEVLLKSFDSNFFPNVVHTLNVGLG